VDLQAATLKLVGAACIGTLQMLRNQGMLNIGSVRNVALTSESAHAIKSLWDPFGLDEEWVEDLNWWDAAIVLAKHEGIVFESAPEIDIETLVAEIDDNADYSSWYTFI
jgi:hypothetical protein